MRKGTRLRWALFGVCSALVVGVLAWASERVLTLEASQRASAREAEQQAKVRVALWRMDSALGSLLSQEAATPWQGLKVGEPYGSFLQPALALDERFPDERVRVRFALRAAGGAPTSPTKFPAQGPAQQRQSAGGKGAAPALPPIESFTRAAPGAAEDARIVAALRSLGAEQLRARVRRDAPAIRQWIADAQVAAAPQMGVAQVDEGPVQGENYNDRQQRSRSARGGYQTLNNNVSVEQQTDGEPVVLLDGTPDAESPLIPVWIGDGAGRALAFAREPLPGLVQGFVLDWDRVSDSLLTEVGDLYTGATLAPVAESEVAMDTTGLVLATAPARLVLPVAPASAGGGWTPTHTGLAVAWLAVLGALGASAWTLRATVADADRRARFASSVTHELRTPLTTFRLYSEMLADGMVADEATRMEYLATLKTESARLAALVENVLGFARVEEGRAPRARERVTVADLVERAAPPLRRRADEAGVRLVVRTDADAAVVANADAVGQILANLVDNACKYGAGTDVELTVERRGGDVAFVVRDHGPGVAPENVAAAFTPFERGNRPPGDVVPGIGLGLALSRGLARDHGGDLVHETPAEGSGAAFVLTLPAADLGTVPKFPGSPPRR